MASLLPNTERSETLPETPAGEAEPAWGELVREKVRALKFGVVQIVVHDSNVVQIESTERHRFDLRRAAEGRDPKPKAQKLSQELKAAEGSVRSLRAGAKGT